MWMSSSVSCLFTNHCHKSLLSPEYVVNFMYCVERGNIETGRCTLFRQRMASSCGRYGCVWNVWAWAAGPSHPTIYIHNFFIFSWTIMPLTIDSLIKATWIIPQRPDAHLTLQHEVKIRDPPLPWHTWGRHHVQPRLTTQPQQQTVVILPLATDSIQHCKTPQGPSGPMQS
jgi:hypothetical protein